MPRLCNAHTFVWTGGQRPWSQIGRRYNGDPTYSSIAYPRQHPNERSFPDDEDELPAGYVYVLRCGDHVKIGYSTNMMARLRQFQTHAPDYVHLIVMMRGDRRYEKELHRRFSDHRVRGEWFTLEVLPGIFDLIEQESLNRELALGYLAA